jgi:uncharacterized membrane protein YeaQ/YmgE (transglycosylase-associated protein family)
MEPVLVFLLVLVIGIAVGLLFQRMRNRGWLTRQIAGGSRADVTAALVGIAGAFIGFHITALLGFIGTLIVLLGAVIGAVVVVLIWREARF